MNRNINAFKNGICDGFPIALGYFAVAFSLGIVARKAGLNPFQGFLSSILNHASAGEYAEFTVIMANASYFEMAFVILVTNIRYLLMSCALSQRFAPDIPLFHRLFVGFGITDEIFGISIARAGMLNPWYNYGAMAIALPCWAAGTAMGIVAGNILPVSAVSALSVALYGMFLAVIIPASRTDKIVGGVVTRKLSGKLCSLKDSCARQPVRQSENKSSDRTDLRDRRISLSRQGRCRRLRRIRYTFGGNRI